MTTIVNDVEKNTLVMRLERNQTDLGQLKCKLSSYLCEPRTPSLFERIQSLRNDLETLVHKNHEIIQSLKGSRNIDGTSVDRANNQFAAFGKLQRGIEAYVAGARNY